MCEVIKQAGDLDTRSRPAVGRSDVEESGAGTRVIPDIWLATILVPVIIGCALFAATSQ